MLQGHNVHVLDADTAFGQYALGDAKEERQQMRTLRNADQLVLDDLFPGPRISAAGAELLKSRSHLRYKLKRTPATVARSSTTCATLATVLDGHQSNTDPAINGEPF